MRQLFILLPLIVVILTNSNVTANSNYDNGNVKVNWSMKKDVLLRRVKRTLGLKERCAPAVKKCFQFMFEEQKKQFCIYLRHDCLSVD